MTRLTHCRSCQSPRLDMILDLGRQPLANALVEPAHVGQPEDTFPLEVLFCQDCSLVQVSETIPPEILFGRDYPYFSSFLPALLVHSREHALGLVEQYGLGPRNLVVEVASNDGYLLKNFVEKGIPVLGVDPAQGPAEAARKIGVETLQAFFNATTAHALVAEGKRADVILANNVLAHVEDINGFVEGFAILLADNGVAEFEFPYLRDLIDACAFDTIYHEHVFYYSLTALEPLFARHGLYLNDVQRIDIHGGSLRLTVGKKPGKTARLEKLIAEEAELGMGAPAYYEKFSRQVAKVRDDLRKLIQDLVSDGKRVAAYGAAAKGATLLNYASLKGDVISYVVDRNVHKVGKYMPGLEIPIRSVETLMQDRPDYLLILAWNFGAEIMAQQKAYADAGGRFILPIPSPAIV
ncbi:MAG: class I SAM-dependent methyltransferase [Beijerinckiaceae bacterium]|nr:class I SAM-dependent methyltransferase [Beijerinckiaceae bacterium]